MTSKPMRIGVDGRNLTSPLSGINRYILEISRRLAERGHAITLYLPSAPHATIPPLDWSTLRQSNCRTIAGRLLWGQLTLPSQAADDGLDLFWGPAHRMPLKAMGNTKKLLTIHDLVWRKVPETMAWKTYLGERLLMSRSLTASDQIIVDSLSTRADLLELRPDIESKVCVVYPGVDDAFFTAKPAPAKVVPQSRYLLFVGTLEPRKNLTRLISAWREIRPELREDVQLLLVGTKGWGKEKLAELLVQYGLQDSVSITGFVTDSELRALYCYADALLMPSLYEGFGLPLLEAQASGTPVLTSSLSSMKEIAGPDAVLVDPTDMASIQKGLEVILTCTSASNAVSDRSQAFAKDFTWEKTVDRFETVAMGQGFERSQ